MKHILEQCKILEILNTRKMKMQSAIAKEEDKVLKQKWAIRLLEINSLLDLFSVRTLYEKYNDELLNQLKEKRREASRKQEEQDMMYKNSEGRDYRDRRTMGYY